MAAAVMAASCMAGGCGKKAASVERISGEERNHDADPAARPRKSEIKIKGEINIGLKAVGAVSRYAKDRYCGRTM